MPDGRSIPFDWEAVEPSQTSRPLPGVDRVIPIVQRLVEARRPRMEIVALALAAGIQVHPSINTQADAARALGVTRAAMSKRVREWRDDLGLRSVHMRSDETRQRCRQAQLRGHWRRQRAARALGVPLADIF